MGDVPERIQLSRARGWRKPEGAVVVARPGEWGNPWRIDRRRDDDKIGVTYSLGAAHVETLMVVGSVEAARRLAVELFERQLLAGELLYGVAHVRHRLAGKDLACWCPPGEPCHGDVLLRVANETADG